MTVGLVPPVGLVVHWEHSIPPQTLKRCVVHSPPQLGQVDPGLEPGKSEEQEAVHVVLPVAGEVATDVPGETVAGDVATDVLVEVLATGVSHTMPPFPTSLHEPQQGL